MDGIDYTKFVDTVNNGIATNIQNKENTIINKLTSLNISYKYPQNEQTLSINDSTSIKFLNCDSSYYEDYYNNTTDAYNNDVQYTSYNNFSLVCELTHYNNKFLFVGDIEPLAQSKLANLIDYCNVYKVEHHAWNYSVNSDFIKKIKPKFSVICGTADNAEYNKVQTVLKMYEDNSKVFNTAYNGTITITSNKNTLTAVSEKGEFENNSNHLYAGETIPKGADLNNYKTPRNLLL